MSSRATQLSDLQHVINSEFRSFLYYLHISDPHFSDQLKYSQSELNEIREAIDRLPRGEDGNIDPDTPAFGKWEDLHTDLYLIELEIRALSEIKTILGNSSFIFLLSIFEGNLKRICDTFVDDRKIQPKNINEGSYTMKARLFLSKVIGVELPNESSWDRLRQYSELRNAIVHENAGIQKKPGKSNEAQSTRYRTVHSFARFLKIDESEDYLTFGINDIILIEGAAEFLLTFLTDINERAMAHAKLGS